MKSYHQNVLLVGFLVILVCVGIFAKRMGEHERSKEHVEIERIESDSLLKEHVEIGDSLLKENLLIK